MGTNWVLNFFIFYFFRFVSGQWAGKKMGGGREMGWGRIGF